MAEVALEHVGKVYANGVRAVHDLNLQVADGELLVLLGPSASGKTTTLRLIAGLDEPTTGIIRIGDRIVNTVPPRDRNVAVVFQKPGLYPHLSVRENLAFGLMLRHRRSWLGRWWSRCFRPAVYAEAQRRERQYEERVAEAARWLELEDVLERRPGQLSGGQQQRAALGRALVRQPAVFLLDEPLSHLDSRLRAELRSQLHLLQQRLRVTMIYVTHDQVEAMTLGDRIAVLDRGVVQQIDPPAWIYERPQNRFVAEFVGWPPMNFLDGRLRHENGRPCFEALGQALSLPVEKAETWTPFAGRDLTLGIRPEAVALARNAEEALTMEVVLTESLGSECLVTFQRGDRRLTGKMVSPMKLVSGQMVGVTWDWSKSHLFDRVGGAALGLPAG